MKNLYNIKPVFNISDKNKKDIFTIEKLLKNVSFSSKVLIINARKKAQVRSIHSSLAIEANSLSLDDVEDIKNHKTIIGPKKDIQEVKNAIELYDNFDKFNFRKEKDLIKAHEILMKYLDDDNGKYRIHGEGIKRGKKIIYQAPDSLIVPDLMESLFEYIKTDKSTHPLILAAVFHYYFVYIHPFTDGNGRTARFWASLILSDYDKKFEYLPIEETMYKHKKEYYKSIESCHKNGNVNVFIDFMLKAVKETIEDTTQKTTQKKLNKNQSKILSLISANPSITRKQLAQELSISEDGVKYNLNVLKTNGFIERIGPDKGGIWRIVE